jgi:hypothetical protein
MIIKDANRVEPETLRTYEEMDGLKVIEELLLFKGEEICMRHKGQLMVSMDDLEKMAHITYGLKVNASNKLYVAMHLFRYYKRADLIPDDSTVRLRKYIIVPNDIFDRVKELNDQFRKKKD